MADSSATEIGTAAGTALALAGQPRQLSTCSAHDLARFDLTPVTKLEFRDMLTPCLALAAPAGMDREDRKEWLRSAWLALEGVPADLLSQGARAAARSADHPSKIVPAIMAYIGGDWRRRKRMLADHVGEQRERPATPEPDYVTPEQAAEILAEHGLTSPVRAGEKRHLGPPRAPTPDEVLAICAGLGQPSAAEMRAISARRLAERLDMIDELAAEEADAPLAYEAPRRAARG